MDCQAHLREKESMSNRHPTSKGHNHRDCQADAMAAAEALCAARGLKFTDSRRRVFDIIWQSHKALSAAEIMAALGNSQPPTTYRALDFLAANGLVHHVSSLNAYVGCPHPAEGHVGQLLICTECRSVTELEPDETAAGLVRAAGRQGFGVAQTHIEMLGRCRECSR